MANKDIKATMKENHLTIKQVACAMLIEEEVLRASLQKELATDAADMVKEAINKVITKNSVRSKCVKPADYHNKAAIGYNAAVRNHLVLTSKLTDGTHQVGVPFYANGLTCIRLG